MKPIPESHMDLVRDETRAFLFLATLMKDGSPQVTPTWFTYQSGYILINTAKGRLKEKNMRLRPQVALLISDPANPYRYLQIRGKVVDITETGALEHINNLSLKYDQKPWSVKQGQVRVIFKIEPERIDAYLRA